MATGCANRCRAWRCCRSSRRQFVVGLGLILLFGRAGLVNQALEALFGITPSRWFYGVFGIWLAQLFAFTPIAFMIMRGVVQG